MTNAKKLNAEKIGQCIAKRRLAANLTQDQVAEKLGIGYEAVSRMERGISIPTIIRLTELAEIFSCGVHELLLESSSRPEDQAEHIKNMLIKLSKEDRETVLHTVQTLYQRLFKSNNKKSHS